MCSTCVGSGQFTKPGKAVMACHGQILYHFAQKLSDKEFFFTKLIIGHVIKGWLYQLYQFVGKYWLH
jgi:hypothetical protein